MSLDLLIQQAAVISREVAAKEALSADRDGVWVTDTMKALQDTQLMGLVVPKANGGLGHGLLALARISEELGKGYSSAGLCFGMHCVGTAVIAAKATGWQQEQYLVPIAEGKHITTLALSETGTGAHFYFPQTPLIAVTEDEFLVNGTKSFVTNGTHADSYVVSTLGASSEAEADQFSCILVDAEMEGLEWGQLWDGIGMRGNSSRTLNLNDIHIPGRNILGEKGDQLWYIFNVVAPYFLMSMAGTYLGIAEAALIEAKATLAKRSYAHNGSGLASVGFLQHKLGTLWAKVERTRRLVYHAAEAGDHNEADAMLHLLSAKAEVAHCVTDVVNEVMTIAGGQGYQHNSHLGMLLRDARAAHVMSPTTDLLYTWMGRILLDQPIFSD
ncbi:acyl-CoA dehydrogenase family protein [Mucilaginibacter aquaedulcis]|uniref:acyl-CoA dehydrogenase family protein n=1 Tax=Mucilaginibacter aquaedulcis TaxID=1187081 RepID=UPI0025B54322|nr:acyl-CoA dehydrogenase family protein [Mucilaginibacter aquaedulcis]MDN3547846.1 acyl-CoA dehydrogenase family protein [Mucilaginibacter aquaedulcis]